MEVRWSWIVSEKVTKRNTCTLIMCLHSLWFFFLYFLYFFFRKSAMGIHGLRSFVHRCCEESVNTLSVSETNGLYFDMANVIMQSGLNNHQLSDEEVLGNIFNKMEEVKKLINPKTFLFISMDGQAPKAKEHKRLTKTLPNSATWNASQRSLMAENYFTKLLNSQLEILLSTLSKEEELTFILSDSQAKGEGEFKVMRHIRDMHRKKPSWNFTIYSADSDVIAQALISECADNIHVVYGNNSPMVTVSIRHLKIKLSSIIRTQPSRNFDDFLFILVLNGSDYLPPLNRQKNGIERLINIYRTNLLTGCLLEADGQMKKANCLKFLQLAARSERSYPSAVDYNVHQYLEGISWMIQYYTTGRCYRYCYQYCMAPPKEAFDSIVIW